MTDSNRAFIASMIMAHLMRSVGMPGHDLKAYHVLCQDAANGAVVAADALIAALERQSNA